MAEQSRISWTQSSWNPWTGCTRVSEGCDHCYMMTLKKRWGADPEKVVRSKTTFRDPLKWKEPRLIFTCSMSDFFHVDADPWRDEAWEIIRNTPHHTYQILTKRPGRISRHLPADWGGGFANVWLGTSVENQRWVTRVSSLIHIPATVRFVSCEPLLGAVDLSNWLGERLCGACGSVECPPGVHAAAKGIDWVIVGGESGPGYRVMDLDWATELHRQCVEAGVPFFMKQDSAFKNEQRGRIPDHLWIQEMPKVGAA